MGAALGGVDRVGVGVDRLGVGAGPLHGDLQADGVVLAQGLLGLEVDDLGVDELGLLGLVEEGDVVAQAVLVAVGVGAEADLGGVGGRVVPGDLVAGVLDTEALVGQGDAQALVEEGHLLEATAQRLVVEVNRLKDGRVRVEGLGGAGGVGGLALDELGDGAPAVGEGHAPHEALTADLGVHPGGQGVDHGDAHAVQAAGDGVAAAPELAAGVQDRHDDLDGGLVLGGVLVDRDAAAVVADAHAAVGQDGDLDVVAVAGQGLVDGVVDDLVDEMVQAPLTGGTDVHAGALPDRFEPFEDGDVRGSVIVIHSGVLVRHVSVAPQSVRIGTSVVRCLRPAPSHDDPEEDRAHT